MPRYNVNYNDLWACFSSICDNFITRFTDKQSYENWRKEEYGLRDYEPAEKRNMMSMEDAVHSIRLNRTKEDTIQCLLDAGFFKATSMRLVYEIEQKYFAPRLRDDGSYCCPNCSATVTKNQARCNVESCEIELVWSKPNKMILLKKEECDERDL